MLQNKYKQKGRLEISSSAFHQMAETKETQFLKQISELQSEVSRCVSMTTRGCASRSYASRADALLRLRLFAQRSTVAHVERVSREPPRVPAAPCPVPKCP